MHTMSSRRSIRRRNAIIPLPLLPPVPSNTIVTSVRIVHNQYGSDPGISDSTAPSPPPSPTPTNLCFAPLTGGSTKRLRSGRRRSSCTPCQAPPDNNCDSSLLNPNRKPRSTIVVTVRLANPAPSNASYGSLAPNIVPVPRRPPNSAPAPRRPPNSAPTLHRPHQVLAARTIGVGDAFAAMQALKIAYRPRVSSPLASSAVTVGDDPDWMAMDPGDISPLSSPAAYCSPLSGARHYTKMNGSSDPGRMAMDPRASSTVTVGDDPGRMARYPLASSAVDVVDDPDRMAMDPGDGSPLSSPATYCSPLSGARHYTKMNGSSDPGRMAMDPLALSAVTVGDDPGRMARYPLASSAVNVADDPDRMAMDPGDAPPLSSPATSCSPPSGARRYTKKNGSSKKSGKGKNGGRIGMLRWAVLNNSGPEVGRRIVSMGPKLAKEIWEAERVVGEIEAVESNEMEVMEHKHGGDIEASANCEEQRVREQLAEECIRELEEMDVDQEDIVMEQSSILEAATTENATETHQTENKNNRMDLDMPAPVAVVTPLSTARQVQIQVEIAVQVFSPAKKAQKDVEKSRRWFERIAL